MFGNARKSPDHLQALARIEEWTRARFGLDAADTVLASEIVCGLPGCPPLETVVAFWAADDIRYRFKLFKRAADVAADDLPYAWLKPALVDHGDLECDC